MDDDIDEIWRALADPTRRLSLDRLARGPETTGGLAEAAPHISRFAVMKHLGVLETAGLVTVRREGRRRWNHLNAVPLRRVYEHWVGTFADQWAGSLLRLQEHVEAEGGAMGASAESVRTTRVESEIVIHADRERVFEAVLRETAAWFWPGKPDERHAPSVIEPWVGGRFWRDESAERGEGAGELYATVATIRPPEMVRLVGDFASSHAYAGTVTIRLRETDGGTRVEVTHVCSGDVPEEKVREFEEGWRDELGNLKRYVETGRAT
ncbi:MAG: SRPBCC domain-containing protein [Phycisphaerales bacterium JB059]